MHQRGGARHPQPGHHCPAGALSPSLCVLVFTTLEAPTLSSPPFRANNGGNSATNNAMGRDKRLSRPITVTPRTQWGQAQPRTRKPRPHTEARARKQASKPGQGGGAARRGCLAAPPKRQHQNPQTPTRTRERRTQPSHPRANTPTTSLNKYAPSEHKERPHQHVWAKQCERGNPRTCRGDRHERSADTRRGHADSAHTRRANNPWFAPVCACARVAGVSRERKAAHNSPRQGAWAECVCGRVCGRLSAFLGCGFWGFGCFLGVFGVFSCFLIFLGCDGCGLFWFVLVRFGWGLLCLMLSVFAV